MEHFPERRAPMSTDELHRLVERYKEETDKGHERLRGDLDRVYTRVTNAEASQSTVTTRVTKLESTPMDATKIQFASPVVIAIVAAAISIAGFLLSINSRLGSIQDQQESQVKLEIANTKLQDERVITMSKTLDTIGKQQELQRLKIESLNEQVLKIQPR